MATDRIPEDFTGRRYGLWTVTGFSHSTKSRMRYWRCRCDCGTERVVSGPDMKRGGTTGCGCTRVLSNARHGHSTTSETSPEYRTWGRMIQRCTNPRHESYPNYGARGITVCDAWLDYRRFFADMGQKPSPKHSLERVNNELGYSKENCIWSTHQSQINNRRTTVFIEMNGERILLTEACRRAGVKYGTAIGRKLKGLPESEWLLPPLPPEQRRSGRHREANPAAN